MDTTTTPTTGPTSGHATGPTTRSTTRSTTLARPAGRRAGALVLLVLAPLLTVLLAVPSATAAGSADVRRTQTRLNALHCDAGPVDGLSGTWTKAAVIRFQSRHGLTRSGTVTAQTRSRLFAASAQRCDVRPVPAGSGTGRRIVVSQAQNWVWVVDARGGVVAQGGVIDNAAELGRGSYGTGSYCGRAARVVRNQSGEVWLDHFVRFAPCGFGFHRIPRSKATGAQIHADRLLGTDLAASHGCIRLSASMAQRIWDFTSSGRTPVRVV